MALKLKVGEEEYQVQVDNANVTVISESGSSHVRIDDEDDVVVEDFFEDYNKVPDVIRYRIGDSSCCVRHNVDSYRICNNRYVNPRCDISERQILQQPEQQLQQQLEQDGSIVLLLESPHKEEYQHNHINCPKAPAMGKTGIRIDRCLGEVLSKIRTEYIAAASDGPELIETGRHVILSNPIQFQTSLDAIHGQGILPRLRNSVWRTLWEEEEVHIQQCFQERLGRVDELS